MHNSVIKKHLLDEQKKKNNEIFQPSRWRNSDPVFSPPLHLGGMSLNSIVDFKKV